MIGSSENRVSYNGNGIATEFAYTFKILEKTDLKVLHVAADGTETLLVSDYYVDMEKSVVLYPGYAPGAEIPEQNRPPILPVGERLVLYREVPITQESALDKHWPFNVIENGLDKLTIICQQIWDRLQRSFYVSESTSTNFDPKVPIEAGKTFRVKDDGTGFEVTEDPGKVIDGATALLKQTTEQAEYAKEQAAASSQSAVNAQNAANTAEAVAPEYAKTKDVLDNIVSYTNTATEQAGIAAAKAEAANTSATNAAQSYANADAVATQLTEYLATKESLTAPVVDKTLLIEGAAADSKVVGELKSEYNDTELEGFTKSFVRKDCISTAVKTSGAFCYNSYVENVVMIVNQPSAAYNWYQLTVKEGEIYHIKTKTVGTPRAYYFAKSDGTYISRVPNDQSETLLEVDEIVTIPSGVELLCVNEKTSDYDDFVFERIIKSLKFSYGEGFLELFENVSNLKQNVFEGYTKENTFVDCVSTAEKTNGKYCYNGYVDSVEKILEIDFASYNYYKLDVSEGETYHIRTTTQNTPRAYYFAKSDGTYISRVPNDPATTETVIDDVITIPFGVEALYINQFLYASIQFVIEKKVGYSTYKRNPEWYSFDSLYGKKLACVGDSITEATNPNGGYFKNYAQIVAERHNMNLYKDGVGGSTMANASGHNAFSDARYLNVPNDYDILTIWFGWNDATYAQVGTIDDSTDTTFYGAYNKVLEYFITTYPTKKIGLIVPYGNSSVEPFRVAVRNLSEKFGVPCLDLTNYNQCSCIWGTANESQEARRSALTYDGTHPNQDGHIYLSTMYEEFVKRL